MRKIFLHPISRMFISTVLLVGTTFLVKEFITKPFLSSVITQEWIIKTLVTLLGLIVMVAVYYLILKYYEKRPFTELSQKHALKENTIGFMLGFLIISVAVGILYLGGFYEIIHMNSILKFIPLITFIMGSAMLEELIFRGIIFKILENWKGTIIALIASASIFQIPHFMNPHEGLLPAILGVLFGVVTALMYANTKRLWLPFAFHFGWNLAQPTLGTTLSVINDFEILFQAKIDGPEILTGSAFGIEDSIISMLALVILIIIYYQKLIRKKLIIENPAKKN